MLSPKMAKAQHWGRRGGSGLHGRPVRPVRHGQPGKIAGASVLFAAAFGLSLSGAPWSAARASSALNSVSVSAQDPNPGPSPSPSLNQNPKRAKAKPSRPAASSQTSASASARGSASFAAAQSSRPAEAIPARAGYRSYRDAQGVLHVTNVSVSPRGVTVHGRRARVQNTAPAAPRQETQLRVPERAEKYAALIASAAKQYNLPEAFVRAVVHTESLYNPQARSSKGAMGLMQLMPATAQWLGVEDAYDPAQNVYGGAKFLRLLANRFNGDMVLVLAGYHAGAGAVKKYNGVPPYASTRAYIKAVMRRFYAYRNLK